MYRPDYTSFLNRLAPMPVVAIFRGDYENRWAEYANALLAGGIYAMEITLNSPGAIDGISVLAKQNPAIIAGAGTVLTAEQARQAIDAGAQFIVSPDTDEEVIAICLERQIAVFPGAYTPTEIKRAYRLGATMVKLFPATDAAFVKAIHAPLDLIPLMATGGVSVTTIADYFKAGASAVGVGSSLVKTGLTGAEIETRARAIVDAASKAIPSASNG